MAGKLILNYNQTRFQKKGYKKNNSNNKRVQIRKRVHSTASDRPHISVPIRWSSIKSVKLYINAETNN